MRLLIERNIDTGQERLGPLSEVNPDILAQLRPLVREAIKSGQRVHVGGGWWCRANVDQGRLEAELLPWSDGAGAGIDDGHAWGRGPDAGSGAGCCRAAPGGNPWARDQVTGRCGRGPGAVPGLGVACKPAVKR